MSVTQDKEKLKALYAFCKSAGLYLRAEGDRVQISVEESGNHYWLPQGGAIPMVTHGSRLEEYVWIPTEDTVESNLEKKE